MLPGCIHRRDIIETQQIRAEYVRLPDSNVLQSVRLAIPLQSQLKLQTPDGCFSLSVWGSVLAEAFAFAFALDLVKVPVFRRLKIT